MSSVLTYDMLEPVADVDESLKKLTTVFAPLYTASWVTEKSKFYKNAQYNMNVGAFAAMWLSKALRIFIGYEDNAPRGYITGVLFRPFTHESSVFSVEDWYAMDNDTLLIDGMFGYMQSAVRFIGVDELRINLGWRTGMPKIELPWKKLAQTATIHFTKE